MSLTDGEMLPASSPTPAPTIRWRDRTPSPRRFLLWNLVWWFFAASCLIGGTLYTENIVRPIAEAGGVNFSPSDLLKKEESSKRTFGNLDRMNILVLGIDYNHDSKGIIYTKGARSDTMMVVSLSRNGDFLNVVSIPRDCRVYLGEGYGNDKINAAYSLGGVEQAKKVVSQFLDIPIHHYVVVKVQGAQKMVDAVGGLPIDVEKDMDYDDNWGGLHIHLKKGPQVLTGDQTVGYARFRHDEESDRGRMRRQQQVLRALGAKLKEPALALRFPQLADLVKQTLETDFKPIEMVDLANLYLGFDFKTMRSAAIVGDDAIDSYGASYIEPYAPENERTVRRLLKSLDWLTKGDLRIRILYKHAEPSAAYRFADRLADAGFDGVQIEALPTDDRRDTATTYLTWFNRIPRLDSVLKVVLGHLTERTGMQAAGRDDDLVLVIGDSDQGPLKELPSELRQPRSSTSTRGENRYNGDFTPRQLPQSDLGSPPADDASSWEHPTVPETVEDVTKEDYPKAATTSKDPIEPSAEHIRLAPSAPQANPPSPSLEAPLSESVHTKTSHPASSAPSSPPSEAGPAAPSHPKAEPLTNPVTVPEAPPLEVPVPVATPL